MKLCPKCKFNKPLEQFFNNKKNTDGKGGWCKICHMMGTKMWLIKHPERTKQYRKKYLILNASRIHSSQRKWRTNNKEKRLIYSRKYLPQYRRSSLTYRFKVYKRGAKERNLPFEISFELFSSFKCKPCYYCGSNIPLIGLDRLDNKMGYIEGNIVPCCFICNRAKNSMPSEEYIERCINIGEKHKNGL